MNEHPINTIQWNLQCRYLAKHLLDKWLYTKNNNLGGKRPIEMMQDEQDAAQLLKYLESTDDIPGLDHAF